MQPIHESEWESHLHYNAVSPLTTSSTKTIMYFSRRDLRNIEFETSDIWKSREVERIVNKQLPDGSWRYPSNTGRAAEENMRQYQTFKNLGVLIEMYGLDKRHTAIKKTAEYFFSNQTSKGDFRGIYDKQYTPNYTAAIAELLIKAGYENDRRIKNVFQWLLETRQEDGGWALPFRTRGYNIDVTYAHNNTIQADYSKPFSHMVTGVVLRAFAAHPEFRGSQEAQRAGEMLACNLFKKDNYIDRGAKKYWLQFVFPFCYTDLMSALDSLSLLGFSIETGRIKQGLDWFADNQKPSGLWDFRITAGRNKDVLQHWLALCVCRILKRFYG